MKMETPGNQQHFQNYFSERNVSNIFLHDDPLTASHSFYSFITREFHFSHYILLELTFIVRRIIFLSFLFFHLLFFALFIYCLRASVTIHLNTQIKRFSVLLKGQILQAIALIYSSQIYGGNAFMWKRGKEKNEEREKCSN